MKKALLIAMLTAIATTSAFAQAPHHEVTMGHHDQATVQHENGQVAQKATTQGFPSYLGDNHNYPFIFGHDNHAYYLDAQSRNLKINNPDLTIVAGNIQGVEFDGEKRVVAMADPKTMWFYYNKGYKTVEPFGWDVDGRYLMLPIFRGEDIAYVSYDQGNSWKAFNIKAKDGMDFFLNRIFFSLYNPNETRIVE